ncbi:MAG: ABC transporter permease subunit, partial [Litorimonas sp.]
MHKRLPIGTGAVLALAGLVSVPMLAVLASMAAGEAGLWSRLWSTTLPGYLLNTGALMLMTGAIAALIGTGAAWCVTMLDFPGRRALSWLLILPLAAPAYIVAYYYADLLEYFGPVQSGLRSLFGWERGDYPIPAVRTLPGAALILALVLYPYVYLLARAAFARQSSGQWHAARSLGHSPWSAFRRVALPSARPAIAGGLALVLMETLADFGVADYFGIPTFSTGIFRSWLAGGDRVGAMMLAGVMLLVVLALVLFESWSRKGRVASQGRTRAQDAPVSLSGARRWLISLLCFLPVLFGFLIPFAGLAWMSVSGGDGQGGGAFLVFARNSVFVAVLVAAASVAIALLLAYARRARNSRLM